MHIHTALSPCAEPDMVPREIVKQAKTRGLDVIGIADHNSTENVASVRRAGSREGLGVVGGLEIASAEEVHVLGFLEDETALASIQDVVYRNLEGVNDEAFFGEQVVLDEEDNVVGHNEHLLIGSVGLSLRRVVEEIHTLQGVAIASHIDRERFSIVGQLGFIPGGLNLDGLEVSSPDSGDRALAGLSGPEPPATAVAFSDAHRLEDIGRVFSVFMMETPSICEIRKALKGQDGRSVVTYSGHC